MFFNGVAESGRSWRDWDSAPSTKWSVTRNVCGKVPDHPKANTLSLAPLLVDVAKDDRLWFGTPRGFATTVLRIARSTTSFCRMRKMPSATEGRSLAYKIANINRSVGTQVSGEIGYQYGEDGLMARSSSASRAARDRALARSLPRECV